MPDMPSKNVKWFGSKLNKAALDAAYKATIAAAIAAISLGAATSLSAQTWRQVGPPGGTVITLEADSHDTKKLYLGTSDGHVFVSNDEGAKWQLLSRIGTGQDDVITHILVDPRDAKRLYASTWTLYSGGGGVYRSDDAGKTWTVVGLAHETVRALAQSPTTPNILLAGSLTGVYRSVDDGATWTLITPAKHEDLRNFDSVAFDPHDDNILYAGTYHLPWKTTNGGKDWFPIKTGMIDDSDVMSVIVDPKDPNNVHATACSGIYHSTNGAQTWSKYKGIPFVFRRTQLIRQDPQNPQVLYAGTTSGLWKTTNENDWKRVTPGDWVINAILIDPKHPDRLILGTERQGVQISENGGATFTSSNLGFQHQHILDVAIDHENQERALVVLTFDTDAFLATHDGGTSWSALGSGLKRTELKHVYAAPGGWWASLNNGGWMKYNETAHKWEKAGLYIPEPTPVAATTPAATPKTKKGAAATKKTTTTTAKHATPKEKAPQFVAVQVNDMAFGNEAWFAATTGGILISKDHGATWKNAGTESFLKQPATSLEATLDGTQIWAISQRTLIYSADGGAHWDNQDLSFAAAGNLRLHHVDANNLFITSNMGLYGSGDNGKTWNRSDVRELQFQDVAGNGDAMVLSLQKHGLLASFDSGKSWKRVDDPLADGYFPVVRVRRNGALVAASATEGLLSLELEKEKHASNTGSSGSGSAMMLSPDATQKPKN
jgi:photosystem II stability/assembly factor-like uncharacterized protein